MLENEILEGIKSKYKDLYFEIRSHNADDLSFLVLEGMNPFKGIETNFFFDTYNFIQAYKDLLSQQKTPMKRPIIVINKIFLNDDSLLEFLVALCNNDNLDTKIIIVGEGDLNQSESQKQLLQNMTNCRVIFKTSIK